jgi:DNA helicase Pif1, 2B domain
LGEKKESVQNLIDEIYPHLRGLYVALQSQIRQYFTEHMILVARNADVDALNNVVLDELSSESKLYASANSMLNDSGVSNNTILNKYLNTIATPGMPLHETTLKLNCLILLLRNLNLYEDLCKALG